MTSTTVPCLCIEDWYEEYTQQELNMIATAFSQNTSLESLKFGCVGTAFIAALDGLSRGNGCLDALKIQKAGSDEDRSIEYWQALSKYLHSTKLLKQLHLQDIHFEASAMGELINGLIHRDGDRPLVSIAKLTFTHCQYGSQAQDALQTFMQTKTESKDGTSETVISNLKEVEFGKEYFDDPDETLPTLAFMLLTQRDGKDQSPEIKWYPTIGSQIQSLSVDKLTCFGRLLRHLVRHAHRVSLTSLHVSQLYDNEATEVCTAIAKIASLRHLSIQCCPVSLRLILLRNLKKNGTMQSVSIPGEIESRLAEAYCERNIHLGELLQRRSITGITDSDREDGKAMPHPAKDTADLLCPTLFEAAEQISLTRASMVLMGLMNMRESIGKQA